VKRHRAQIRQVLGFREPTLQDEEHLANWLAVVGSSRHSSRCAGWRRISPLSTEPAWKPNSRPVRSRRSPKSAPGKGTACSDSWTRWVELRSAVPPGEPLRQVGEHVRVPGLRAGAGRGGRRPGGGPGRDRAHRVGDAAGLPGLSPQHARPLDSFRVPRGRWRCRARFGAPSAAAAVRPGRPRRRASWA
jgi:hypothetical protein